MFALGYPRFRYIIDGHPDDEPGDLDVWIQRCFRSSRWHQGVGATPRGIAFRQLRVVGCADQGGREPSDELQAALTNGDPLSLEEAQQCIRIYLQHQPQAHLGPAYLFEALFGPDVLLETLVPLLEAADPASIQNKHLNYCAASLAPLLRRATQASADAARAKLEPVYDSSPAELRSGNTFVANLGLALGGSAHARNHGQRYGGSVVENALEWSEDDPSFIHEQVMAQPIDKPYVAYPRLVFLGGDDLNDRYQRILAKEGDPHTHRLAVETFGRIKSLGATRLLLWLATKSKAKDEALAWLKQHKSVFEPFLEEIDGTTADDAKLVNGVRKKLQKL